MLVDVEARSFVGSGRNAVDSGRLEYLAFCLDFLAWIIYLDQSPLMNLAAAVSVSCKAIPLLAVLAPGSYQLKPWRTRMLT